MNLLVPFDYEFFRRGLFAAVIVGGLCGYIGVYVVLRRMSYIGHGLSHAIFGGAVLSYIVNVNFYLGAGLWALLAALLIHTIRHRRRHHFEFRSRRRAHFDPSKFHAQY